MTVKTIAVATWIAWRLFAEETEFMNKERRDVEATPLTQRYTSHTPSARLGSGLHSSFGSRKLRLWRMSITILLAPAKLGL